MAMKKASRGIRISSIPKTAKAMTAMETKSDGPAARRAGWYEWIYTNGNRTVNFWNGGEWLNAGPQGARKAETPAHPIRIGRQMVPAGNDSIRA